MSDTAQTRLYLTLLAIAALLLAFSLGAISRMAAEAATNRSRQPSETATR
jgi:hypothetical protein